MTFYSQALWSIPIDGVIIPSLCLWHHFFSDPSPASCFLPISISALSYLLGPMVPGNFYGAGWRLSIFQGVKGPCPMWPVRHCCFQSVIFNFSIRFPVLTRRWGRRARQGHSYRVTSHRAAGTGTSYNPPVKRKIFSCDYAGTKDR